MNNGISGLREFSRCRLDLEKKVLWCKQEPVPLPLKAVELLCLLVEKKGEVVTKGEIWQAVWQDSFVEETNLTHNIYLLRKTLKDLGEKNLIQTVPRRGYRFAGEVREIKNGEIVIEKHSLTKTLIEIQEDRNKNAEAKTLVPPYFRVVSLAAVTLVVTFLGGFAIWQSIKNPSQASSLKIKSIAVLPFKAVGPEKENQHQGLGLADVLITRLSNIKTLNVRPTSAILNFENQDSTDVGEKLKVDAVLEGTIYRTGDKIRVTARLVKTSDNSTVWTGEFEKPRQDELRLQNEIALQIVNTLALNLNGNEKNALTKRYTESADAYQLYVKGRYEWNKRSWPGMVEAQRQFRNAIEEDPNFALAYVGLADTLATSSEAEAFSSVKKALELDPNLAEAHASMGFLQMFHEWKWTEAETSFKKSIELNPGYSTAHHWYATLLGIEGRNDEAKAEMLRALEINPLSYNFLADLGQLHYFAREYDQAKEYCHKSLEIYPDFQFAHEYLADIYLQTGEYDKGIEEEITSNRINLSFTNESAERKEDLEAGFNRQRKIYQEGDIKRYVKTKINDRTTDAFGFYSNAMSYAFLGEKETALNNLEKAFDRKAFLLAFVKADPVFDSLREELRYREILRKMNLAQ